MSTAGAVVHLVVVGVGVGVGATIDAVDGDAVVEAAMVGAVNVSRASTPTTWIR